MLSKLRILIVDDESEKKRQIAESLIEIGISRDSIRSAESVADAREKMEREKYDLLILDICIPNQIDDLPKIDNGINFLNEIEDLSDDMNVPQYIVCITGLVDHFDEIISKIRNTLWSLIKYDSSSTRWKKMLKDAVEFIEKTKQINRTKSYLYDMLIVCALEELELGAVKNVFGEHQEKWLYDEIKYYHFELNIEGKIYYIAAASQKRMGMVPTSVVTAQLLGELCPKVVVMTGICGGYKGKINIGDLIVGDPVWEYQFGKITSLKDDSVLNPSVDQYRIDSTLLSHLSDFSSNPENMFRIQMSAPMDRPDTTLRAKIAPFVTGSAVISSSDYASKLRSQHRDIAGLDMELFGLYYAGANAPSPKPKFFGVKAVSDYADEEKADNFQKYCAYVSAKFLYEFYVKKARFI